MKNASSSNSNTIEKSGLKRVTGLLFTIKQYKTPKEMSNKLNPMQFLFSLKKKPEDRTKYMCTKELTSMNKSSVLVVQSK